MSRWASRPLAYKIGVIFLFVATLAYTVGFAAPYWITFDDFGSAGLWMTCVDLLNHQVCVSNSAWAGWLMVVQGMQCSGLCGLAVSCILALTVNCCAGKCGHSRVMEGIAFTSGGLGFSSVMFFVSKANETERFHCSWEFGLDLAGCIIAILAAGVTAAANCSDVTTAANRSGVTTAANRFNVTAAAYNFDTLAATNRSDVNTAAGRSDVTAANDRSDATTASRYLPRSVRFSESPAHPQAGAADLHNPHHEAAVINPDQPPRQHGPAVPQYPQYNEAGVMSSQLPPRHAGVEAVQHPQAPGSLYPSLYPSLPPAEYA